jgi:hypothetical protein
MPEGEALSDAQLLEELRAFFLRNPQFEQSLRNECPPGTGPGHGTGPDPGRVPAPAGDLCVPNDGPHDLPSPLTPPPWLVTAAKDVFELRGLDAELAELTWDSLVGAGPVQMRSPNKARMLSFESLDLTLDLEVTEDAGSYEIVGHLMPPTVDRIEVDRLPPADASSGPSHDPAPLLAVVDETGQFVLGNLEPGRIRLLCHREGLPCIRTAWFRLS